MDYKQEILNYKEFCNLYFHESNSLKFLQRKQDLLMFFQSISLLSLLGDYDISGIVSLRKISKICIKTMLNFLYAIPTGNDLFISACARQFSEDLIKLIYAQYFKKIPFETITSMKHRDLWEGGIKQTSGYKKMLSWEKEHINSINLIFQQESDTLHFKKIDNNDPTQYLQQIVLKGSEFNDKKTSSLMRKFSIFILDILPIIFKLDIDQMTMRQRNEYISLVKLLDKSARKKLWRQL